MMDNKKIRTSLHIIYEVNGRYEAAYISEFFKMCGIMVVENEMPNKTLQYESLLKGYKQYDHTLFLGIDKIDYKEFFDSDCDLNPDLFTKRSYQDDFLYAYKKNDVLFLYKDLIDVAEKVLGIRSRAIQQLARLYVETDYCKLCYIKRYYTDSLDDNQKEKIYNDLLKIIVRMEEDSELWDDKETYPYVLHAKLLCARKVNDICHALKWSYYYQPETMIAKCMTAFNYVDEFPSIYILAASFCYCDAALRGYVIPFYRDSLRERDNNSTAAGIYYKLGQYFEKNVKNMEKANCFYTNACQVLPEYYRGKFKEGAMLLEEKRYTSAISVYIKIIEAFNYKRMSGKLFPVEYEYLCKCYLLIGLIYDYYWSDAAKGSVYYKEAIRLVEDELEKSSFFEDFLRDEEDIFKEYLIERIALREHILVEKYR